MSDARDLTGTDTTTIDGRVDEAPSASDDPARVATHYRSAVEAGEVSALAALYRPDALLDAHVPGWRFQVQGREEVAAQASVLPRPGRFTAFDVERTTQGLLVQFQWRQHAADGDAVVRQLHAWRLVDGRIAEQILFCAGVWGRRLQARMAVEAPLVRP